MHTFFQGTLYFKPAQFKNIVYILNVSDASIQFSCEPGQ